jgi:hypothetical protein
MHWDILNLIQWVQHRNVSFYYLLCCTFPWSILTAIKCLLLIVSHSFKVHFSWIWTVRYSCFCALSLFLNCSVATEDFPINWFIFITCVLHFLEWCWILKEILFKRSHKSHFQIRWSPISITWIHLNPNCEVQFLIRGLQFWMFNTAWTKSLHFLGDYE